MKTPDLQEDELLRYKDCLVSHQPPRRQAGPGSGTVTTWGGDISRY